MNPNEKLIYKLSTRGQSECFRKKGRNNDVFQAPLKQSRTYLEFLSVELH